MDVLWPADACEYPRWAAAALKTSSPFQAHLSSNATFKEYCRELWQMSRPYAYKIMQAAEVVDNLSAIADISLPRTESQAANSLALSPSSSVRHGKER